MTSGLWRKIGSILEIIVLCLRDHQNCEATDTQFKESTEHCRKLVNIGVLFYLPMAFLTKNVALCIASYINQLKCISIDFISLENLGIIVMSCTEAKFHIRSIKNDHRARIGRETVGNSFNRFNGLRYDASRFFIQMGRVREY